MFAGSHQLTVDEKGRLAVPARYRHALDAQCQSQVVITMGYEPCLEIYPELLKRAFVGRAVECELDKQGRISVPTLLRRQAHLDTSVVLVGQINRFELWAEDKWTAMYGEGPDSILPTLKDAFRALKR